MKRSTLVFGILTLLIGLVLFRIKYAVIALEIQERQLQRSIQSACESVHVLKAEWAHLNDPKRLQILVQKYLGKMGPVKGSQLVSFQEVASRDGHYDSKALDSLLAQVSADDRPSSRDRG